MQTSLFNYLHDVDKSCSGYDSYLKKARNGNPFTFNLRFLLFQSLFFVYHRMYFEAFIYTLIIGSSIIPILYNPIYINLFLFVIITSSLLSYKIYEMRNNRIMESVKYDPILFFKKITPYDTIRSLINSFLMCFLLAWTFVLPLLISILQYIKLP